jgi:putative transposase
VFPQLHVNLVFVTKYRRKIFDAEALNGLKLVFDKVCQDFEAQRIEMYGE